MKCSLRFFLFCCVLFHVVASFAQTKPFRVFNRYNYYLTGNKGCIIAALGNSVPDADYKLLLSLKGVPFATSGAVQNHVLKTCFDLDKLPAGTTTLHYVVTKEDNPIQEGNISVVKLAAKANAVQIDNLTGGLIADGLPFFPFGFYCGPVEDLPQKEVVHGFNMIGPYQSNLPQGLPERKAYMDRCAQLGMKVQYSVNSLIGSGHNGSKGLDLSDDQKLALLKSEIIAFRDHPALLSWYINDEPDGQGRPPAVLEKAYGVIHELDPYHPVSVVFMMPDKADDFRNTMDIAMTDPYPIPGPADAVLKNIIQYNKTYRYQKSVWLVPQAFGGQEMWKREPTAAEIRMMTYMGLIGGAKGIQYFIRGSGNTNPQSVSAWSACSNMAVEVAQMTDFLLSADSAPAIHTNDAQILTKAFCYKGDLLVLAVNEDNQPKPLSLQFEAPDTLQSQTAALWFENRSVPFAKGTINDMIDANGTRVYLIKKKLLPNRLLSQNNIIVNPGFENITSPGVPDGLNKTYTSRDKKDIGATTFTDSRQSIEGMFSLRLITPADSGGNKIRFLPVVMNKGNSYAVSIWAKAKEQDTMPQFRLAVDAMEQSHDYKLTNEWQKYSFAFTAPSSSTTSILTLELLTKGTAWFDVVQASPTPVINYNIKANNTAVVTIESDTPDATLRYAIDKQPDAGSPVYKEPFVVNKAATVYAAVFKNKEPIAASNVFVPVNLALGKPVQLAIPFSEHYKASGDSSLTDGIMGSTAFKDGKWLGFSGTDLNATVDMQQKGKVNSVTASFLCDPNSGIFLPPLVSVYTSADGKHFSLAGEQKNTAGNVRGEPYLHKVNIPIKTNEIRYIRVVAKAFGAIPEGYLFTGSTSWLFADEILVQ